MFKDILSGVFNDLWEGLDNLFTSDDERNQAKNKFFEIQAKAIAQAEEYEEKVIGHKKDIIVAEAEGHSWLQRNWRPLVMLNFAALMTAYWLGWTAPNLPESAVNGLLEIVKVGLGGYVVGRSAEKIAKGYYNSKK